MAAKPLLKNDLQQGPGPDPGPSQVRGRRPSSLYCGEAAAAEPPYEAEGRVVKLAAKPPLSCGEAAKRSEANPDMAEKGLGSVIKLRPSASEGSQRVRSFGLRPQMEAKGLEASACGLRRRRRRRRRKR